MIGRRGFLRVVSAGAASYGTGRLFAQDAKTKGRPKAKPEAPALTPNPAIDRILAPVRDGHHLPGLVGAVVTGALSPVIGAVGLRKVGSPEPITVNDIVHIGSCTKAMTATLIGLLVDEGKLTWQTTLGQVFPERSKNLSADVRSLSIVRLLEHRAGLPHDPPSWWDLPGKTPTEKRFALLDGPLKAPLLSKPGTKYEYSNLGYALAGAMAEKVMGRSWEDLMRERLFKPLGMTSAGFGPPGTPGKVDQPWGHVKEGDTAKPIQGDNAAALGPAGTVHCTMADWVKFASLHMLAAEGKPKLLKAATFRVLHTPPAGGDYAGGWIVTDRPWAGGRALTHSGSNTMWYCTVWIAPVKNFAALVATNIGGDGAAAACDKAIEGLIQYHFRPQPRRR